MRPVRVLSHFPFLKHQSDAFTPHDARRLLSGEADGIVDIWQTSWYRILVLSSVTSSGDGNWCPASSQWLQARTPAHVHGWTGCVFNNLRATSALRVPGCLCLHICNPAQVVTSFLAKQTWHYIGKGIYFVQLPLSVAVSFKSWRVEICGLMRLHFTFMQTNAFLKNCSTAHTVFYYSVTSSWIKRQ